jgi:plasmid maintenance system killer protein
LAEGATIKSSSRLAIAGAFLPISPNASLGMLEVLDEAENLHDLAIPRYAIHPLRGVVPPRYSMSVNGPWRITFQFESGEVHLVDLEQYH